MLLFFLTKLVYIRKMYKYKVFFSFNNRRCVIFFLLTIIILHLQERNVIFANNKFFFSFNKRRYIIIFFLLIRILLYNDVHLLKMTFLPCKYNIILINNIRKYVFVKMKVLCL